MNSRKQVVISMPHLTQPSYKPIQIGESPSGQVKDAKTCSSNSLEARGSFMSLRHGSCKSSAFSIYDPSQQAKSEENNESQENLSNQSSNPMDFSVVKTRKWKKIKRSKREMNRIETKNLNRYFRSKINEMLRDIKDHSKSQEELQKAEQMLKILNKSNNIMFSELRDIIKNQWLQKKLTVCSGILLKYIHNGKMGTHSKMIMLKYYNKIMKAIRNPENFSCWK